MATRTRKADVSEIELVALFEDGEGKEFERPLFVREDLGVQVSGRGNEYFIVSWAEPGDRDTKSTQMAKDVFHVFSRKADKALKLTGVALGDEITRTVNVHDAFSNGTEMQSSDLDIDGRRYHVELRIRANGSAIIGGRVGEATQRRGRTSEPVELPKTAARWV